MKNILVIFCFIFLFGCSSYKTIGNYKYKTHFKRSNIGEFEALIYKYELFVNKDNDTIFPVLVKAQKLDFETKKDSIFAYGKLKIIKEKDKIYIITKEINLNGYDNFTEIDSIVRFYQQKDKGNVKFIKANYYRNGIEKSYPIN
jgi:hypothetical protein